MWCKNEYPIKLRFHRENRLENTKKTKKTREKRRLKMGQEQTMKLYAVRDKSTGKFVSDITNPRHKFWEKKGFCEQAIVNYKCYHTRGAKYDALEMVELTCIENKEYERLKEIEYMYNDLCD